MIESNPDSHALLAYSVQTELKEHISLLAKFISPRNLIWWIWEMQLILKRLRLLNPSPSVKHWNTRLLTDVN